MPISYSVIDLAVKNLPFQLATATLNFVTFSFGQLPDEEISDLMIDQPLITVVGFSNMKNAIKIGLALTLSIGLSACAKSPASIAPVSMAGAYDNISCKKARPMLEQERQTLAALETQQKSAQTGDAIGVFLVLIPVSSLTGADREGAIATSKGKVLALEARVQECS